MTTEEVLAMVYGLNKFKHYFLSGAFYFVIDLDALKYLGNKSVLHGHICIRWLLFEELH